MLYYTSVLYNFLNNFVNTGNVNDDGDDYDHGQEDHSYSDETHQGVEESDSSEDEVYCILGVLVYQCYSLFISNTNYH